MKKYAVITVTNSDYIANVLLLIIPIVGQLFLILFIVEFIKNNLKDKYVFLKFNEWLEEPLNKRD